MLEQICMFLLTDVPLSACQHQAVSAAWWTDFLPLGFRNFSDKNPQCFAVKSCKEPSSNKPTSFGPRLDQDKSVQNVSDSSYVDAFRLFWSFWRSLVVFPDL
ncbi:hypothetical protein AMECASPLE_028923 [Ameca splendens]|uniref:Secreted protein n=2 Tax=Goodeidae TaxID=28758 RepID=A0ABV0NSP9_9TELE